MANSAHFGGNKTIATINDALIRVGTGPVRTLVVASVLSSAFPHITTLDMEKYWTDTFEVSVISSKLAAEVGMDTNEVFTTGILHNIGELMIHTLVPEQAMVINQRIELGEEPFSVQEELLDVSSPTLGARLARSWKFPEEMADAIEHFNEPREAEVSPKLATILHFARSINERWDLFQQELDKANFLAEHPDSRLLSVSASFAATIDRIRGNGRDIAMQMVHV